jgi:DNA-binding IclR family transcriptional regulator
MTQRAAILHAIRNGRHRTVEIAEATGIPRDRVQVRIAELVRERLVSSYRTLTGRHGNEKFFRIRD